MNYSKAYKALFQEIGPWQLMALATHDGESVTSRTVSVVVIEEKLYFQTDRKSIKARQLLHNGNAAVSFGAYEILGKCCSLGHPLSADNSKIFGVFQQYFTSAANKYSHLEDELLFQFVPTVIKKWVYSDHGAEIHVLDIKNSTYEIVHMGY